jgi:hypothetical protein
LRAGAIYAANGAAVEIYSSEFNTNSVADWANTSWGGAIFVYNAVLKIYASTFNRNLAPYAGGAIMIYKSVVEDHDSIFISNEGAIYLYGSLEAFNCTFQGNIDVDYAGGGGGGAVDVGDGEGWDRINAAFTGCLFLGNDGTKGHNDIARESGEGSFPPKFNSSVTFACADGEIGIPVQMQGAEITVIPPKELQCAAGKACLCQNGGTASGMHFVVSY